MSSDRPIFVVGCARSGTTLLTLMLNAHPNIAIPSAETRFLLANWGRREQWRDLGSEQARRRLGEELTKNYTQVHVLGMDREALIEEIVAAPPTLGSAFGTVFAAYARQQGKLRWGDKRPAYSWYSSSLLRLFPDAQIVHIMRDGRANVASLKNMSWWRKSSIGAMATWAVTMRCAERDAKRLPADVFHVLRYEDLVAQPGAEMERLCAFLGEEFDEAMLQPHLVSASVAKQKRHHKGLSQEVGKARKRDWQSDLKAWELGLMEVALRRKLVRHGYQPSGLGKRPTAVQLAKYEKTVAGLYSNVYRRWTKEALEARRDPFPVAARLTSGQRRMDGERTA